MWRAHGVIPAEALAYLHVPPPEPEPELEALESGELVALDHRASSHSTRGHLLQALRAELRRQKLPDAREVQELRDGRRVRYAGLVICRQRPGTASGVVFMTLEDETGFVNVILHARVFQEHELVAKTEPFLGVTGKVQVEQGVVHVIAERLWVPQVSKEPPRVVSRDFH